jgi:hypothetical protein
MRRTASLLGAIIVVVLLFAEVRIQTLQTSKQCQLIQQKSFCFVDLIENVLIFI